MAAGAGRRAERYPKGGGEMVDSSAADAAGDVAHRLVARGQQVARRLPAPPADVGRDAFAARLLEHLAQMRAAQSDVPRDGCLAPTPYRASALPWMTQKKGLTNRGPLQKGRVSNTPLYGSLSPRGGASPEGHQCRISPNRPRAPIIRRQRFSRIRALPRREQLTSKRSSISSLPEPAARRSEPAGHVQHHCVAPLRP